MARPPKTTTAATGQIAPFGLRMLPALREQIEEAARQSGRSMNAEIVARLQASFEAPKSSLGDALLREPWGPSLRQRFNLLTLATEIESERARVQSRIAELNHRLSVLAGDIQEAQLAGHRESVVVLQAEMGRQVAEATSLIDKNVRMSGDVAAVYKSISQLEHGEAANFPKTPSDDAPL